MTALALGAMNFGKRTPAAEAERIVARAIDLGVEVFDTANAYGDGESERVLGRALRGRRDGVRIATKVGFGRVGGKPEGLSGARVRAAIDESLGRLATDRVDVYYLHVPDRETPIEETLAAIGDVLRSGKAAAFGVSNFASWEILEIVQVCDREGIPRPVTAQQIYNLLIRQLDVEYLRFAARYALHTTVYNPLAGGLLTGRHRPGDDIPAGSRFAGNKLYQGRYWSPRMLELAAAYADLARAAGLTPVELAYRWLAQAPGVDSILVGPGSLEHLEQAASAVAAPLDPATVAAVEALHLASQGTLTTYAR
jgi:aryl-alcohol dehydrogenase-like predicted oxidoreductase